MGKTQCVSLKAKTEFWEIIEKSINNIDTPLDKKIYDEYYKLKANLKSKIKKEIENSQKKNSILIKKQMDRFFKWYYMSHPNQRGQNLKSNKTTEDLQLKKIKIEYLNAENNAPISTPNRLKEISNKENGIITENELRKNCLFDDVFYSENYENKIMNKCGSLMINKNDANSNIKICKNFETIDIELNNKKNNNVGNDRFKYFNNQNDENSKNINLGVENFNMRSHSGNNNLLAYCNSSNFENKTNNNNLFLNNKNNHFNQKSFNTNSNTNSISPNIPIPKPCKMQDPIKLMPQKNSENIDDNKNIYSSLNNSFNKNNKNLNLNCENMIDSKEMDEKRNSKHNICYNKNFIQNKQENEDILTDQKYIDSNESNSHKNLITNKNSYFNNNNKSDSLNNKKIVQIHNSLNLNESEVPKVIQNDIRRSSQSFHKSMTDRQKAFSNGFENCSPFSNENENKPRTVSTDNHIILNLNQTSYINSDRNHSSIEYEINSEINYFAKANIIELNLRKFHDIKRTKFYERVFKGPPNSFRWISWLISARLPLFRDEEKYFNLKRSLIQDKIDIQIKKDLHRTLSDFSKFNYQNTQNSLYNILKALAINDKEVGYCQGMNFIAGFLLIMSDFNELETFYLMISLMSHTFTNHLGIRGFFSDGFPLLGIYVQSFHFLFEKKMPELKKHFKNLEIPDEVWISKWFQTLFTLSLPIEFCMRIWDCILSIGLEFLLKFTLAFIKYLEGDLLRLLDLFEVIEFFKKLTPFYLVENEGNMKAIEDSLTLLSKLNVEEIIQNAKKIILPNNFLKNQMDLYVKNRMKNFNNNKNNYKDNCYKNFSFSDLKIIYENFNLSGSLQKQKILFNEAASLTPSNNPFSPPLSPSKFHRHKYVEDVVLDLDESERGENNLKDYINKVNLDFNIKKKSDRDYKISVSEDLKKTNNENIDDDDRFNFKKKVISNEILINLNNSKNYKNNYNNSQITSDNADLKTYNSTDYNNNASNFYKERSKLKIVFPNESSSSLSVHSENRTVSSNIINSESLNNNLNKTKFANNYNNTPKNNNLNLKNSLIFKNKTIETIFNSKPNSPLQMTKNLNTTNYPNNREDKKTDKLITSITIENTPTFNKENSCNYQNFTISNFNLIEKSKTPHKKDIIVHEITSSLNSLKENIEETNVKKNSKSNFFKEIPNEQKKFRIEDTKNIIQNRLNNKIHYKNSILRDKENENDCHNIPNDINDWELDSINESYRSKNNSIDQEITSEPENSSNISYRIKAYTLTARTNKPLKPHMYLNDLKD